MKMMIFHIQTISKYIHDQVQQVLLKKQQPLPLQQQRLLKSLQCKIKQQNLEIEEEVTSKLRQQLILIS